MSVNLEPSKPHLTKGFIKHQFDSPLVSLLVDLGEAVEPVGMCPDDLGDLAIGGTEIQRFDG